MRSNKAVRRRAAALKQKNRRLWIAHLPRYNPSAGYLDWKQVDGEWVQESRVKYPKSSKRQRYYKRQSNKAIRRSGDIYQGNQYRKCFDYWWRIY